MKLGKEKEEGKPEGKNYGWKIKQQAPNVSD